MRNLDDHPCFNPGACASNARVHLPVAPSCNMQCGYCNRSYDCANESRPGVASVILTPYQALGYLERVAERTPVSVVGIAGPGDPFASPELSLEALSLARDRFPDMLLCVATNGLGLPDYAGELARLGVSHVTVTVNAVDPRIGAKLYEWMRIGPYRFTGADAAEALLERQEKGIKALKAKGVIVKVNTVVVPGINDGHISSVAAKAREWGVDYMNCMALMPVAGSKFGDMAEPDGAAMREIRKSAGAHVRQISHCRRCRADAAGLLDESASNGTADLLLEAARSSAAAGGIRDCIALASREGAMVNLHLGECRDLRIFKREDGRYRFIETRRAPEAGAPERWRKLAALLSDCSHVLASGAGANPVQALSGAGISVLILDGVAEAAMDAIAEGRDFGYMRARPAGACAGAGLGCSA